MKITRPTKLLVTCVGSLLSLVGALGYLSVPHFYLTRSIFWGESAYKVLERFPARTVHNGPFFFHLDKLPAKVASRT